MDNNFKLQDYSDNILGGKLMNCISSGKMS
jgi:hypothetical protein